MSFVSGLLSVSIQLHLTFCVACQHRISHKAQMVLQDNHVNVHVGPKIEITLKKRLIECKLRLSLSLLKYVPNKILGNPF